jgi:hypothetical protein
MRQFELNFGHIQQRVEHWAIVDLKGEAGHIRTIPVPTWVKNVLDQWLQAANITSGKLFRRVQKRGKACGERLTEKTVWHVVREYAAKAAIDKLAPHDLRSCAACGMSDAPALGYVTWQAESFSRFNSCLGTYRLRQLNAIACTGTLCRVAAVAFMMHSLVANRHRLFLCTPRFGSRRPLPCCCTVVSISFSSRECRHADEIFGNDSVGRRDFP